MKRYLFHALAIPLFLGLALSPSADASESAETVLRSCSSGSEAEGEGVPFVAARELFLDMGLVPRGEGSVETSGDLEGGIMAFGGQGRWIYVTSATVSREVESSYLIYSALTGTLHTGEAVEIESGDVPGNFEEVTSWSDLGPQNMLIGGETQLVERPQMYVNSNGRVISADFSGAGEPECAITAEVDCWDFCIGNCSVLSGRGCRCNGFGTCVASAGYGCSKVTCTRDCVRKFVNPGQFGCFCE